MRTRLPGRSHPEIGAAAMRPALQPTHVPAVPSDDDLGPFSVRRFVDFAMTESMICRPSA